MRASFQLNCPHCGTKKVAFESQVESWFSNKKAWQVCAQCNHCRGFVVLELDSTLSEGEPPSQCYNLSQDEFTIKKMHPAGEEEVPAYLPEDVERFFKEGVANVPDNPNAAGMMFRRTLEAVLRDKCPDATGSLQARIDKAAKSNVLTSDLKDYAHTIRLEGNEAAHGTYNQDDSSQLYKFLSLMLQYIYTLPGTRDEISKKAREARSSQSG